MPLKWKEKIMGGNDQHTLARRRERERKGMMVVVCSVTKANVRRHPLQLSLRHHKSQVSSLVYSHTHLRKNKLLLLMKSKYISSSSRSSKLKRVSQLYRHKVSTRVSIVSPSAVVSMHCMAR